MVWCAKNGLSPKHELNHGLQETSREIVWVAKPQPVWAVEGPKICRCIRVGQMLFWQLPKF